jgi:hypothetical protein
MVKSNRLDKDLETTVGKTRAQKGYSAKNYIFMCY